MIHPIAILFALICVSEALRASMRSVKAHKRYDMSRPVSLSTQLQYAQTLSRPSTDFLLWVVDALPMGMGPWENRELKQAADREEGAMFKSRTFKALDFLMGIPIVHDVMFGVYRKQTVEKAEKMGLAWTEFMDEQWGSLDTLKATAEAITDPAVTIPDYYYAPIHAYKVGR